MTTKAIAKKWKKMCRKGQHLDFITNHYAENVICREKPGFQNVTFEGKETVLNKGKAWFDNVETFHKTKVSKPIIAGNFFTSTMSYDATFKDKGRRQSQEVGVFEVQNGKIISEQFFY